MNQKQLCQLLRQSVARSNKPFPLKQQRGHVSLPDFGTFDQLVGNLCYQIREQKHAAFKLEVELGKATGG